MNTSHIAAWDSAWAERYPKRIKAPEKEAFLQALDHELRSMDFLTERLTVRNVFTNRLLLTRCERPEVIFMAHYDTPTIMPFWLSPFFTTFGHTRQILMSVALILFLILPKFLAAILSVSLPSLANVMTVATNIFYGLLVLSSISLLIPNPRNREDNTSGVIGLLALADRIKDQPAIKEKVQFVFIDNEEWGLLGSGGLKELWDRRGYPYRNAVVISMDCISRGQVPLLIYNGKDHCARQVLPHLQKYLPEARLMNLGFIPLSDNFTFRDQGAMNITFTDRTILPGGYYVPRIHAPNDHDLASQRLASCVQGLYEYIEVGSV